MYHYEMLGDERFQELCQSLISVSFPNTQCLPVGQPDGGRDAFLFQMLQAQRGAANRDLLVFQVKYVKNVADSRDEREMIESLIKTEGPKVSKLKEMGMTKYYFLTNVKGTAHLEVGSIDRVNRALSEAFDVEAYCWWRDDIDRRVDANSSLKWSFPDILKATDLLEKLVAGQLGEEEERRRGAIRAYMNSQYDDDEELKFKQTDLRSTMTELFVDLPMHYSSQSESNTKYYMRRDRRLDNALTVWVSRDQHELETDSVNAAEYFIDAQGTSKVPKIVLEGAPGQGKSTVTQFVCQVLRMRLLGKHGALALLPKQFQHARVRIPFRVDLRDFAKWIAGVDPFISKAQPLAEHEPKSLEGFLAGQVRFASGGHTFNVSDLTAVARASHIFLALDGFDEVAEIGLRQKLVDEITKGANRLASAGGYSVQTIVTSRPAAFAKSGRFSPDQWSYFELLPLEGRQIEEYTSKWMKAKGLKENLRVQLKSILDTKLSEAHIQYLAKNPMQLTILLSLVNSRGTSLPDKRTAMYDSYMDMFFSRESEKSEVVRENRDLLIDIHRYLAWKLQSAAESGDNGSVEHGQLRSTLFSYLDREGEDTTIVGALFDGMIERVGALVSRVQGTYEFEVQPLREYFAARHLYETAPYPSDDQPTFGDKFERFKALVSNPYWLNVARFYGGCFNKGEILTLVNELVELSQRAPYQFSSHPRSVALMLLGDWVFSQYQPAVKQVIAFISSQPQFRYLLANAEQSGPQLWTNLPERSGRLDFLDRLWCRLIDGPALDEQRATASAIVQNSSVSERYQRWLDVEEKMSRSEWARLANFLELLSDASIDKHNLFDTKIKEEILHYLVNVQRFDTINDQKLVFEAKKIILNDSILFRYKSQASGQTLLEWLFIILSTYQYTQAMSGGGDLPLNISLERRFLWEGSRRIDDEKKYDVSSLNAQELKVVETYEAFIKSPMSLLSGNLEPWRLLVGAARSAWGDCAAIDRIAFLAAGVRSKHQAGVDQPLETSSDLVETARFIRLKSGAPRWWEEKLRSTSNLQTLRRLMLLLQLWGTSKTLLQLTEVIEGCLEKLSDSEWKSLVRDFKALRVRDTDEYTYHSASDLEAVLASSSRTMMFIGARMSSKIRFELAASMAGKDLPVGCPEAQFAFQSLMSECKDMNHWKRAVPFIQILYKIGVSWTVRFERDGSMPKNVAEQIMASAGEFPLGLIATADRALTAHAGSKTAKLAEIAQQQKWFHE